MVLKDWAARLRELRQNIVDDPTTTEDDETVKYRYGVDGEWFEPDERKIYLKLKNGEVFESSEIAPENLIEAAYTNSNGDVIAAEDLEGATHPDDSWVLVPEGTPLAVEKDGDWYYSPTIELRDGTRMPASYLDDLVPSVFQTPDGRHVSVDDFPTTPEEIDESLYEIRTPDGLTVLVNSDGTVPEGVSENLESRQSTGRMPLLMNMGIDNPRGFWEDRAGNTMWGGDYDIRRNTFTEFVPKTVDMLLSSVPYFNPYSALPVTAGEMSPYLAGIDGNSYQPDYSKNFFTGATTGTFGTDQINRAQQLGGVMSPIVNLVAERIGSGGRAIGINESGKLAQLVEKYLGSGKRAGVANAILSGGREGMEEVLSAPWEMLSEGGFDEYAMPKYYNEVTGEFDFDPNGSRLKEFRDGLAGNFMEGASMGTTLSALRGAKNKASRISDIIKSTQYDKLRSGVDDLPDISDDE